MLCDVLNAVEEQYGCSPTGFEHTIPALSGASSLLIVQHCGRTPLAFIRLLSRVWHGLDMARQVQCVGCDRNFYWPFGGTLMVLCGPEWYRVVFVGLVGI